MEPHWVSTAKKRMKALGITQSDLLEVFGVTTRGAVGHYFSGRQSINVEQLEALSEKLGMRIDYYEVEKGNFSLNDIDRILDSWLPRLAQVGLVEYKADPSAIKKLLLSSFADEAASENNKVAKEA
ncbi:MULTISPECIES: helix-turn-helix domain-containing protein [Pseudoalteromonas]|uniref:helix-turn-helix domain-containing protein n=1 Tax=Pseudoalteromonas TaxID=53246 RepID=UPI0012FDAC17|nr:MULTISPECIES: helix-turn-helix transcriptional regulator [Pseudoalteromonas]MDW7548176.1 helix-turn-helix transcriptional regulator [Pseudoalteromonas peptidolytica]